MWKSSPFVSSWTLRLWLHADRSQLGKLLVRWGFRKSKWGSLTDWRLWDVAVMSITVWCWRYDTVNFLKYIFKIHPIARPVGRGMEYVLWFKPLIDILAQFLQWCLQYLVIHVLDRVIMTFKSIQNGGVGICYEIVLRWMAQNFANEKSTLVQVMAWCRQAPSHYLSQCWPRSMLPYDVTIGHRELTHVMLN